MNELKIKIISFCHIYRDIIAGIGLFIIFALYFHSACQIKSLMNNTLNSGFVPKIIAILMMIISALIIFQGIRQIPERKNSIPKMTPEYLTETDSKAIGVVRAFGVFAVTLILIQMLGFIVGGIFYLFFQITFMTIKSERNYKKTVVISIAAAVLIYLIFRYAFEINLPMGIFG